MLVWESLFCTRQTNNALRLLTQPYQSIQTTTCFELLSNDSIKHSAVLLELVLQSSPNSLAKFDGVNCHHAGDISIAQDVRPSAGSAALTVSNLTHFRQRSPDAAAVAHESNGLSDGLPIRLSSILALITGHSFNSLKIKNTLDNLRSPRRRLSEMFMQKIASPIDLVLVELATKG